MKAKHPDNCHFYAACLTTWATTNEKRSLPELLRLMNREAFPYTLWFVPHPPETKYDIRMYAPQIEGAVPVGHYDPRGRTYTRKSERKLG